MDGVGLGGFGGMGAPPGFEEMVAAWGPPPPPVDSVIPLPDGSVR
jgi:hypothetical protein